jgi:hypothetical protein
MSIDPVFNNVGKKPGLEAWHIQNMKPVAVAPAGLNKLYSGDSYIFLKTNRVADGKYASCIYSTIFIQLS